MTQRLCALLLVLILVLAAGCTRDTGPVAGTYTASGETPVTLTLDESGKGTWSTDLDEITFKWSVRKGNTLWVHTKEGGVIQGAIEDGRIRLALPGVGEMEFERE